jgi:uncharacterized membrane protein HdeD (DUF308 family)
MSIEVITKGGFLSRGIFALIIGILCFAVPIAMQDLIAYIIGIFLLIISIVTGGMTISKDAGITQRIPIFILSLIGVILGILIFISPIWMVVLYTILIAVWLIVTGLVDIFLAISLTDLPHRFLLWVSGFIAIIFGILIGFAPLPTTGSLLLIILLGIYCLIFGIISIIVGLLMKKGDAIASIN